MKFLRPGLTGLAVLLCLPLRAAEDGAEGFAKLPSLEELTALFHPLRYDRATISPDGKFVAYTETELTTASIATGEYHVSIVIRSVDAPTLVNRLDGGEKVSFLDWTANNRLVYQSERTDVTTKVPGMGSDIPGYAESAGERPEPAFFEDEMRPVFGARATEIRSVDALGKKDVLLANPELMAFSITPSEKGGITIPRRPEVINLSPDQGGTVNIRARLSAGRQMGLYRVNALTGKRSEVADRLFPSARVLLDATGKPRIATNANVPRVVLRSEDKGVRWEPTATGSRALPINFEVDGRNYFTARAMPVAFDGAQEDILYYASNVGRNTFGLYALDLKKKAPTAFRLEDPDFDLINPAEDFPYSGLVWDRHDGHLAGMRVVGLARATRWADEDIAKFQKQFDENFPSGSAEIINWDQKRQRFLLLVTGASDPGRYYIYDRGTDRYTQFLRREPALEPDDIHPTRAFTMARPNGGTLSGYVTTTLEPVLKSAPMVVMLHDGPSQRTSPGYNPSSQALAAMGLVVVDLNYTGSSGFGTRFVQEIQAGFDQVPVADVLAAVQKIAAEEKTTPGKVALLGEGFGGYVALRALQLHPEVFASAVTINPVTDLGDDAHYQEMERAPQLLSRARQHLLKNSAVPLDKISVLRQVELITQPIMVIQDPAHREINKAAGMYGNSGPFVFQDANVKNARTLHAAVRKAGNTAEYLEVDKQFSEGIPSARAKVFYRIEEFLTGTLYDFGVKIRDLKVQEDKK